MSLVLTSFADKVRVMNQTQSKHITLTALEARNLQTEIFMLLSRLADINATVPPEVPALANMDGGSFT